MNSSDEKSKQTGRQFKYIVDGDNTAYIFPMQTAFEKYFSDAGVNGVGLCKLFDRECHTDEFGNSMPTLIALALSYKNGSLRKEARYIDSVYLTQQFSALVAEVLRKWFSHNLPTGWESQVPELHVYDKLLEEIPGLIADLQDSKAAAITTATNKVKPLTESEFIKLRDSSQEYTESLPVLVDLINKRFGV